MYSTPTMAGAYEATDSNSGMSKGCDLTADVNMQCLEVPHPAALQVQTYPNPSGMFAFGAQRFATMPMDVYPSDSNLHQRQQQPMSLEYAQTHNSDGYSAGSMPLGPSDDTNGDSLTVTIRWQRADRAWGQARVAVTDQIRDAMTSLWPKDLQLVIHAVKMNTLGIQEWFQKNRAPLTRFMCIPGTDDRDFNELLELLRNCGGYATAGWEAGGSYLPRLLLAPLCMGLLCAAFPVDGTPELPTSRSRSECTKRRGAPSSRTSSGLAHLADPVVIPTFPERPQHEAAHSTPTPQQLEARPQPGKLPHVDYYDSLEDTIDSPEVDADPLAHWNQAITSAPVRVISPPPPEPEQQTFTQVPRQQSIAQQSQQVATMNMLSGSRTDAGAAGWVTNSPNGFGSKWPLKGNGDPWFGYDPMANGGAEIHASSCNADVIELSANSGLDISSGGPMDVDGTYATRSPGADLEDMY